MEKGDDSTPMEKGEGNTPIKNCKDNTPMKKGEGMKKGEVASIRFCLYRLHPECLSPIFL